MTACVAAGSASAQEPAVLDGRLSPDGLMVVARALDSGSVRLRLAVVGDSLTAPSWITPPGLDVETAAWTPTSSGVVFGGSADGGLYFVALDGTSPSPPRRLTPGASPPARFAGFVGEDDALVELPGEWPDAPDLYRVPLRGGEPVLVARNQSGLSRWIVVDGEARLALRGGEDGEVEIVRLRDGIPVPIYACAAASVCVAAGFTDDGRVWVVSNRDRVAPALLLVDPITLEIEVTRTELGVDTDGHIRSDSLYARDMARLRETFGDVALSFPQEPQARGGRMLVAATGDGGLWLHAFDRWAGSVTPVFRLAEPPEAMAAPGAPLPVDPMVPWPSRLRYRVSDSGSGTGPTEVVRRVERRTDAGREVIVILDESEVPVVQPLQIDTALLRLDPSFEPDFAEDDPTFTEASDTTVLDALTLRPVRRRTEGPVVVSLDFGDAGVSGFVEAAGLETSVESSEPGRVWSDGAALEALVAALPLADGYETDLPLFDSGLLETVAARLEVTDGGRVDTAAGAYDTWRVVITADADEWGVHTWLVARPAPHVILRADFQAPELTRIVELLEMERR